MAPPGGQENEPAVKVLLVDDRPSNLTALEAVLAAPGLELVRAASGEEALRRMMRDEFAAVLLDLNMPGLTGFDTARLMRDSPRCRHTPVLFVTAGESPGFTPEKAYELGAADYLEGRPSPAALRAKVEVFAELARRAVRMRRSQEAQRAPGGEHRHPDTLRRLLDSIPVGVAVTEGAEHRFTLFNPVAAATTGLAPDRVIGRTVAEVVPETAAAVTRVLDRVLAGGGPVTLPELEVKLPDGRAVWYQVTYAPLPGPDGRPAGVVHLGVDLGPRHDAERERARLLEAAGRERSFLEAVLRQMPGGVVIADADGRIVLRSGTVLPERPATVSGYGQHAGLFADGGHADPSRWPLIRSLRTGEVVSGEEMEFRRPDGSRGVLRASSAPVRDGDGRLLGAVATWDDVTAQRRDRDALKLLAEAGEVLASSLDYEETLAAVARLVVPRLADWCTVYVADEAGVLRLIAAAHADPAKVAWARELGRRFPPDPAAPGGVYSVFRSGRAELAPELTDEMLAGAARDADHLAILRGLGLRSAMVVPLAARGRALGVVTFAGAESGRRFGPADLELAGELARRAALAVDNARLYSELREADRRKDRFLATLAHELRNPLAPLLTTLGVLRQAPADAPDRAEALDRAERQARHLGRMVDDLLDASRLAHGRVRLRPERLDLARLAATAAGDRRAVLARAGLSLTLRVPQTPVWVRGDPARLTQALDNLLENAAQHTDAGGSVEVRVEADAGRGEAAVAVRDTGVGIDRSVLPRLFRPFEQAEQGIDRARGGLGLGLAVVKGLAELHGGRADAYSAGPGSGSEFVLRLPLEPEPPALTVATPPALRPTAAPSHRPQRVLLIEDNRDAAQSLRELLTLLGSEAQVAFTGPDGVAAAEEFKPDVVISDIGLPGFDGYEVARRLRRLPGLQGVPLVALTGYGSEEDRRRGHEAGFDHFLVKPAGPEELLTVLTGRVA